MTARTWTAEQKLKQAEVVRTWAPWSKSTGPKSSEGKALVSRNAWKGGCRAHSRELIKQVNEELRAARQLLSKVGF